jgi:deoxyribonuclease-4
MKFGAHVSAAGGLSNAPKNAAELDCEVLQMFSRPPQGGKASPITPEVAERFQAAMLEHEIERAYIHAPYFINLASGQTRIYHGSITVIREELERGSLLGCRAMMFHPGSAKDMGEKKGVEMVIEGLNQILDGYTGSCQLLIEISAGAGAIMGDQFEEVAAFLEGAERGKEIGVCFDTQHAFASGYEMRTKEGIDETFRTFDKLIGLDRLVLSHCNDSKVDFGAKKDRHEHLGEGKIGKDAFKILVQHPKLQHLDLILETPIDEKRPTDMKLLRSFRKKK